MNNRMELPLQMECILLFQSAPDSHHSLESLSKHFSQTTETLEPIMDLLVKQGIIEQSLTSEGIAYRYQEPQTASEFEFGS